MMPLLRALDRTELFPLYSGQGSGVNENSFKQRFSDPLVFRAVQDINVMFQ